MWLAPLLACLGGACSEQDVGAQAPPAALLEADASTLPWHRLADAPADHDPLLASIGTARFVALGEATHGTREFYRERARISMRLIRERGFRAVAIEGDWPDAERVNRYVRGFGSDRSAREALQGFTRFPRWMWRNAEFADFIEQLRAHNLTLPAERRSGVYGIDVYNLYDAADAVVRYLAAIDPAAAEQARRNYRCFQGHGRDPQRYGEATRRPARSCARQAQSVAELVRSRPAPADVEAREAYFAALRSAASVIGAEEYFRASYAGSMAWNVRDRRMASNVEEVASHVAPAGGSGKLVIWAHNSHVGDARATDAARRGELNLGQLLRERHGEQAFLLGFLTHSGSVIAAREWGAPGRTQPIRPALAESFSGLFHDRFGGNGLLLLKDLDASALNERRLERAIGVIYRPDSERISHYLHADLRRQFDAVIFLDRTAAVTAID